MAMRRLMAATALIAAVSPCAARAAPDDALLRRLEALEAKVARLEARNAELEGRQAADASPAARPAAAATRTASAAAPAAATVATATASATDGKGTPEARSEKEYTAGVAPTFADRSGQFSFKPRGTLDVDVALYDERAGGYDYDNGTAIRRGRFGFEGKAFGNILWRLDAEYTAQQANILDAYVQYAPGRRWLITAGQHKTPQGLEANSSDNFNQFLERGMAVNAFGNIGAERRIGVSLTYVSDHATGQIGLYGAPEAQSRGTALPDETWGGNARLTWDPVVRPGRVVHVGASGYVVNNLRDGMNAGIARVQDRPDVRVDDSRILDVRVPFVRTARAIMTEAAVVYGPVSVQGEYGMLHLDRSGTNPDVDFDGGYVFATLLLTGETRPFRNGVIDRLKPRHNFDPANGGWGAFELAVRYDRLSLTDRAFSPLDREARSWTVGLNWYLNPNTKFLFDYLRFTGENSPLVAGGATTAKADVLATRLHFDF